MSSDNRIVEVYFDPISPYAYLALEELAKRSNADAQVTWQVRPVVYAKLLEAHGLVGPVETEAKRRYTMLDVLRCAERSGLKIEGPPAHPFRSLSALRVLMLFAESDRALDLALAIGRAAWADGLDLESWSVLETIARSQGFDADDLENRSNAPDNKQLLIQSTSRAFDLGVFGVPGFVYDGELFWGHDRIDHLFERLDGKFEAPSAATVQKLVERPMAVRRPLPN